MLRQTILLSIVLMAILAGGALAQENTSYQQPVRLTADKPAEVTLTLEPGLWRFLVTATEAVDPTLALISPGGALLAFGDDYLADSGMVRDALIRYWVAEPGRYTLLVDSFNGVSEGDLVLRAERQPDHMPLGAQTLRIGLEAGEVARLRYTAADAGTVRVIVTAEGVGDPWVLAQHEGSGAVFDDAPDLAMGANTLQMTFEIRAPFDLLLRDFAGRRARFIVQAVPASP